MIILLFSAFWAMLLVLMLCAPDKYYLMIAAAALVSFALFVVSLKAFKKPKKLHYILSLGIFIFFFFMASLLVYKPHPSGNIPVGDGNGDKKAVIFYCDGEMEKYTPDYSYCFLKNTPDIFKPFKAFKLKNQYKSIGVNEKNGTLIHVASGVKDSLLNNGPILFYVAFSSYTPGLKTSVGSAIKDGCSEITIINYTDDDSLNARVLKDFSAQKIKLLVTEPISRSPILIDIFVRRIVNMPSRSQGVLLISPTNSLALGIQEKLYEYNYTSDTVFITEDVKEGMNHFKALNTDTLLYVNLLETGPGIDAVCNVPLKINSMKGAIKVSGIQDWGYDSDFIRACIEEYIKASKSAQAPPPQ